MKKRIIIQSVIAGSIFCTMQAAQATDIGLPLYEGDIPEKEFGIEVYHTQHKQDLQAHIIGYSAETPALDYEADYILDSEDDRIIVRTNYYAGTRIAFHAEVGTADFADSKEKSLLLGAGLRTKVYSGAFFDVSLSASMTYIPEASMQLYFQGTGIGDQYVFIDQSYSEINGAFIISKVLQVGNDWKLVPYGGGMYSDITGDVDMEVVADSGGNRSLFGITDQTINEDNAFSPFAGFGLMFNDTWGLRVEGRFSNQESYSGGLTYFF